MKRPTFTHAEDDVTSAWRHLLCYLRRAGVTSGIKRGMRRRERHGEKAALRQRSWE